MPCVVKWKIRKKSSSLLQAGGPTDLINSPHGAVPKLHYAMESVPVLDYAGKSAPASMPSRERFIASGERFAPRVPPPTPPNLLLTAMKKGARGIKRVPQVVELFQELRCTPLKKKGKLLVGRRFMCNEGVGSSSILTEIARRSHYAQCIRADIEEYGPEIEDLIRKIASLKLSSMNQLLDFVGAVDKFLDKLSDETAVLKNFDWPHKYYAFRDASALYKEMIAWKQKLLEWKRLPLRSIPDELKEMEKFAEKCNKRIDIVQSNTEVNEKRFRDAGIPWSNTVVIDVKHAALLMLEKYMALAMEELDNSEKLNESSHRVHQKCIDLLTGTVNFAFKVHQFSGGFTEGCTSKFSIVSSKIQALRATCFDGRG